MHRSYQLGGSKQRSHRWRIVWVIGVILAILVIASVLVRHVYYKDLQPVSGSQKVVLVTVQSGSSTEQIADLLQKDGLIRSSNIFQWYVRSSEVRDELQAGTYALRPSMSVSDIVSVLVKGKIASNLVTILPGQRIDQIRQTFINAGFQPSAVDAALQPSQYSSYEALSDKPTASSLEGFLYPDSFQKNANTDPKVIIRESLNEMAQHLTPDIQSSFAKEGLSVYSGVTLASIVEKEVSNPSDQAQAAQVFVKRLSVGMPLGSDVTAFYGAILAGKDPSTTYDSPYNTLLHKGLPPGPISTISDSALEAVAHPASTDWLYFVAGDNGTTYFTTTLQEQQADAAKYCHKLCSTTP